MPSEPSWSLSRPDGVDLGVHELGSGPPVILVHGTACDHRVWARVSRRLATSHTVHALDRRGRGASGDGPGWDLQTDGEDVAAIAEEIGGAVPVVGHSLGAIVALEAARLSRAVGPIVAYEPPLHGDEGPPMGAADELARLHEHEGPQAAIEAFLHEVGYDDEQIARLREHEQLWHATLDTASTLEREVRADLSYEIDPDRMAAITSPVLLLEGADSPDDFQAGLDRLAEALPNVQREAIEGASHTVLYEAPGRLAKRIEAFLDAQP